MKRMKIERCCGNKSWEGELLLIVHVKRPVWKLMSWYDCSCLELSRRYWVACKCDCLEALGYVLGCMIVFCSWVWGSLARSACWLNVPSGRLLYSLRRTRRSTAPFPSWESNNTSMGPFFNSFSLLGSLIIQACELLFLVFGELKFLNKSLIIY